MVGRGTKCRPRAVQSSHERAHAQHRAGALARRLLNAVAGRDETRLFSPADLISAAELTADAQGALAPGEVERDRDLDAARMWLSKDDGLRVRGVKPHSADKSKLVSRGIDTVSSAMSGKWFATKFGVEYVEFYSGPGRLLDMSTGPGATGFSARGACGAKAIHALRVR
jgi:hypothetical protein